MSRRLSVGNSTPTSTISADGQGRRPYLTAALFFCPRLAESLSFAAFRPGFFRCSGGSSSPSIGGFPCPARSRIRRVSARSALRPLSRKYSSVRKAETFSATATLMSWFRATPSTSAALRSSSSKEAPSGIVESAQGCKSIAAHVCVRLVAADRVAVPGWSNSLLRPLSLGNPRFLSFLARPAHQVCFIASLSRRERTVASEVAAKPPRMLASPTGLEPVLPP